ncbi:NACHT domain-containing protein [Phytomonospora sp. NPDC050363]|uniref:NACHT domain-containing protein n=1 Tax=Phytomonospora sp. NPDC050363 TaxID=3155642 RepID=UPI0033E4300E
MDLTRLVPPLTNVVNQAARPFIQRAWSALVRKGHVRSPDAYGRLEQIRGPHQGDFSALSIVFDLPENITHQRLLKVVGLPRFQVFAKQLIALRIAGQARGGRRLGEAAFTLFADELFTDAAPERRRVLTESFRPAFDALWKSLDTACARVAEQLTGYPVAGGDTFNWAQATLSLATAESAERYVAFLAANGGGTEDSARWMAKYRLEFDRAHGRIPLPDLGSRREIPFAELYVEPEVTAPAQAGVNAPSLRMSRRTGVGRIVDELDRTVIVGNPGAGKSTLSKVIGIRWSRERGPVFLLPVRGLNLDPAGFNVVQEIERVLARGFQTPPPPGLVERTLLEGGALVIFDGVDEVSSLARRKQVSRTIEAVGNAFPLSAVLVTARGIGYPAIRLDTEVYTELEINPFTPRQVEEYVGKWFRLAASFDDSARAKAIAHFMETSGSIHDLRSNPLMLSFICVLYRGHADIPRRRTQIYRKCVELLLRDWDLSRGIVDSTWEVDTYEIALIEIAALMLHTPEYQGGMTERQLRSVAARNLLSEVVADRREAERLAGEVIELCRGRGWLFTDIGPNDEGEEIFAFTHRSLMEYFAARHHVRHSASVSRLARELVPHIVSQKNPVLAQMCLSIVSQNSAAGSSQMILELLAEAERSEQPQAGVLREFCVLTADTVPLNRDALRGVLAGFLESMPTSSAHAHLRLLLGEHFRHSGAVPGVLKALVAERLSRDAAQVRQLCLAHPWLWDFCLERGLLRLADLPGDQLASRFDRLFGGELHTYTRRPPFTSAMALLDAAFPERRGVVRTGALRDLALLRETIGSPFDLHQLTAMPPLPGGDERFVPEALRLGDRALARAAGHRREVLGAVLYLVLALGEMVVHTDRRLDEFPDGLALRLCRARRKSYSLGWEPPGIGLLPYEDAEFLRSWIRHDVTIFVRETDYGVS